MLGYRMSRERWRAIRRDDITLVGVGAARAFLDIDA
jgi:hypothetical protein